MGKHMIQSHSKGNKHKVKRVKIKRNKKQIKHKENKPILQICNKQIQIKLRKLPKHKHSKVKRLMRKKLIQNILKNKPIETQQSPIEEQDIVEQNKIVNKRQERLSDIESVQKVLQNSKFKKQGMGVIKAYLLSKK